MALLNRNIMKQFVLIIGFLSFYNYCFSQELIIMGKVMDSNKNTALNYANIGIANKSVGTVSDSNGIFKLKLNDKVTINDTIQFSYVGFKTKKVLVSALKTKDPIVLLEPQNNVLKEVIIKPKKFKLRKVGKSSAGLGLTSLDFYSFYDKDVDDRLSREMGMKFELKKECKIKDLNFRIASNQFKSLKFRVNFYNIKNDLPNELIVSKNIITEIQNGYAGWYTIDLEPYNIYFDKGTNEIAVTLQWIESKKSTPRSKYFSISGTISPFSTNYYRGEALSTWTKSHQSMRFYLTTMVFN